MTDKKKLVLNCAACDMRNAARETLECYDSIVVNTAMALVDPEVQPLLAELPITMNAAAVINAGKDVMVSTYNGSRIIRKGTAASAHPQILIINGKLTIEPGTGEYLERCQVMIVNGVVQCPESLAAYLGRATINGVAEIYPDGAVLLENRFSLDRIFVLRAHKGQYYVGRRLVVLDAQVDFEKLCAKGASFLTPKVLAAESLVEKVLPLVPEGVEVNVVPDGTAYVSDDLTLDKNTMRRYGSKLFVDGDVTLEQGDVLEALEYLEIAGDITLPEALVETVAEKAIVHGEFHVRDDGSRIADREEVTVDEKLLALCPEGVEIIDCEKVTLAESLVPEQILAKVKLLDCASVFCTEEQKAAVELVSRDVDYIGPRGQDQSGQEKNTIMINTAKYCF